MNNNAFAYDPISHPRDSTASYVSGRQHNLFNMADAAGGQPRGLDGDPHTMSLVFEQQQPFSMPLYQYDPQLRNRQMFFPPQPHTPGNNETFYVNPPCPQAPVINDDYGTGTTGRSNGKYQNQGSRQPTEMEEISEEEKERQRVKREKNRIAAAKCRNRRREQLESLEKETEQLERENKNKRDILRLLQEEKENLTKALEDHEPKCTKSTIYDHKPNP